MSVPGTPPSDDRAPRSPRNLWTGDWLSESERARRAAEQAAGELPSPERPVAPGARRPGSPLDPGADAAAAHGGSGPRGFPLAAGIAVAALVALLSFAVGYLLVRDDTPEPLPAVSGKPLKPRPGQSRAGAVYAKASPAVVSVRTGTGSGTGFLIEADGKIVTNAHVAGDSKRVTVRFGDGASVNADVLGTDPSSDLAVLSIERSSIPKGVKPLQFADSRQVQVGDEAIAIGNPFGLDRTATEGIVSGIGRSIEAPNGFSIDEVIPTDAPINPGNSGGPLLDETARVIGVNSQIATAGSQGNVGIGFAVPSNTVRQVVPRLERGDEIERGYLGVESSEATALGGGAEVQTVVPGGPAERADLRPGDVIKKVDGRDVKDPTDVSAIVTAHRPGDEVEVEVDRSGQRVTVKAKLEKRPEKTP